jgi:hypothetical protein
VQNEANFFEQNQRKLAPSGLLQPPAEGRRASWKPSDVEHNLPRLLPELRKLDRDERRAFDARQRAFHSLMP